MQLKLISDMSFDLSLRHNQSGSVPLILMVLLLGFILWRHACLSPFVVCGPHFHLRNPLSRTISQFGFKLRGRT